MTNSYQKPFLAAAIAPASVALMTVVLRAQGRVWWCKLGDYSIYISDAWNSSHTSQHFLDPYSFTHVGHGVLFFWIIALVAAKWSGTAKFSLAVAAEAAWEVLENSRFIIEKYRENTASLDYFGDSIFNSVGDVLACAVGFAVAVRLGWLRSVIFFLAVEIGLLIWIRDGLLLNILMLIWPIDSVKDWQMSGF